MLVFILWVVKPLSEFPLSIMKLGVYFTDVVILEIVMSTVPACLGVDW